VSLLLIGLAALEPSFTSTVWVFFGVFYGLSRFDSSRRYTWRGFLGLLLYVAAGICLAVDPFPLSSILLLTLLFSQFFKGHLSTWEELIVSHWDDINWPMGVYITLVHVWALIGVCKLFEAKTATLWFAFTLWPLSCLGITAGAHRLWSHRSYKASLPLRIFLMILSSLANQGSIFHWARDHRVHHKHSETPADPHNAARGFFFAHMGWLYLKKDERVIEAGRKLQFPDLYSDPVVMFQKRLDPWFALFVCYLLPGVVASLGWGERFSTGVWVAGALRYAVVLHITWLVNSAAHLWGSRPYDSGINPAENAIVSFGAIGEGWHNWHHAFPFDYSASEFSGFTQFNPTTAFIDACVYLGMAWDTKRATSLWRVRKARLEEKGIEAKFRGPVLFRQRVLVPKSEKIKGKIARSTIPMEG